MEILRPIHHTDWLLIPIGIMLVLLLMARLYDHRRFRAISFLPFHGDRNQIEENFNPVLGRGLIDISLSFFSYLALGLALFVLVHPWKGEFPLLRDWQLYLQIVFLLLFFFVIKNLISIFTGWIFSRTEEVHHSQNISLIYRVWISMWIFPVGVAAVFFPASYRIDYYILVALLCAGVYLMLQFTAVKIWQMKSGAYHKIFYLCALEITPLIFLADWLKNLIR